MAQRKSENRTAAIEATKPKRKRRPVNPAFKGQRTLAQDLLHLRKLKREAKELRERADAKRDEKSIFERYVLDRMEFEGVDAQRADHTTFAPTRTIFANVTDLDKFLVWAKEQHELDLIKPDQPRDGELNTLIRRLLDDGEPLPPGVDYYVKEIISMRAS